MRDTTKLHPILQCKIKQFAKECEASGLKVGIGECVRTKAEQDALYAKGRTAPGSIVTNVKYPNSQHCWGIAFDFYRNDGKGAYYNNDKFFQKVGKIAKEISLCWGGDWTSFQDLPHVYIGTWGSTTKKLIEKYKTPDKYMATWWKVGNKYTLNTSSALHSFSNMKDSSKVKFDSMEEGTIKSLCKSNADGYAVLQKGSKFTLSEIEICTGYVMGRTKSGYWIPLFYNGKERI